MTGSRDGSSEFIAHRRESDGSVQLLGSHLLSVGNLCARSAAKLSLAACGELLGLLHDLGKYSLEFQNYIASATGLLDQDADDFVHVDRLRGKIDHSTAGAQHIWRNLQNISQNARIAGQFLALCIASHHSGLIDCIAVDGDDEFSRRMAKPTSKTHLEEALVHLDAEINCRVEHLLKSGQPVAEIIGLLQAIVRSEKGNKRTASFKAGLLARMLFSNLIDADRIDTADFQRPELAGQRNLNAYVSWKTLIDRLENHIAGITARSPIDNLRRNVSDECLAGADRETGCFTLTVPTGGGKTLASLRFALKHADKHRLERVIFVVPFTSIIDQNADVVRGILEPGGSGTKPGSIVLEHHSNLTLDEQTWQNRILSENWDAPVVFTSSVQFLETVFGSGTRSARRMHHLAKSVIIFDEAQTIPIRCIHMFNNAINFLTEHCSSTVVLCTATQPLLNRVDVNKGSARVMGELMSDTTALFKNLQRVHVLNRCKPGGWSEDDVAQLADAELAQVASCLIIVNTRNAALSLYRKCADRHAGGVFHLSTSMCPAHRRATLAAIRKRLDDGASTVCVSTQLIEAGVDVDFEAVIRYVAGLDSIAQAAGRCNRNGRQVRGSVHVVNPADEKIDRLTDIRFGRDVARRVLDEFTLDPAALGDDLLSVESITRYFSYYFFQRANDMLYAVPPAAAGRDDTLLNMLGGNDLSVYQYKQQNRQGSPNYLRQAFMKSAKIFQAIDAPTHGIIVQYGAEGRGLVDRLRSRPARETAFQQLRLAQQYSINVFPYVFESLQESRAIEEIFPGAGIYYLHTGYYSDLFGLKEMETVY